MTYREAAVAALREAGLSEEGVAEFLKAADSSGEEAFSHQTIPDRDVKVFQGALLLAATSKEVFLALKREVDQCNRQSGNN